MQRSDDSYKCRARARRAAWLLAGVLTFASASSALAEGGSVRYSYEQVSIGGAAAEWVLVPQAETGLSAKLSKSKIIDAFELLRRKKRSSYGKAEIRVTGNLPNAKVAVIVDPQFAPYAPIVIAETVYTMAELGVDEVAFPGYADGAISRAHVPFPVYTLTVPMWKAIAAGGELGPGQVLLPDGQAIDMREFYSRWKKKDQALVDGLYSYLKSPDLFTITYVMALLPQQKLPYTSQTIPLLTHPSPVIRAKALELLATQRDSAEVLTATAKALEAENADALARQQAEFLGKSKNAEYAALLPLFLAERGKPEELPVAIDALKKYKSDARVLARLEALLGAKTPAVAQAAATALADMGQSDRLIAALANDQVAAPVRESIAQKLAADKNAASRLAGLTYLATNGSEYDSRQAIASLATTRTPASRQAVEAFLTSPVAWRREAAAEQLALLQDPASLPAISAAIKKNKTNVEPLEQAGYSIIVAQPLKAVQELTRSSDNVTQRMAYLAIGERAMRDNAGPKVLDTLRQGASSSDPLIRGASARALGRFADNNAADILKGLLKDKNAEVRRDVAVALGRLKDGVMVDALVAMLDDKDPQVVAAAIDALADRKEALAWDKIKGMTRSAQEPVRASALRALALLVSRDDKAGTTEVISTLSGAVSDPSPVVSKAALQGLGSFNNETAVFSIAAQLSAKDEEVRMVAFESIGATGHPSAVEPAQAGLVDESPRVRAAAARALSALKAKSARNVLQERLKSEKDQMVQEALRQTIKEL